MKAHKLIILSAGAMFLFSGCGTMTTQMVRFQYLPYDMNENAQTKDGLTVEEIDSRTPPDYLYFDYQKRDESGVKLFSGVESKYSSPRPVMAKGCFMLRGQFWAQISITNNTDHVLRLNDTVIKLLDPVNDSSDPLTKENIIAEASNVYRVPSYDLANYFGGIKLIDRNVEVLPSMTFTGWIAFRPPNAENPGIWKVVIYEIPVRVDDAGLVKKRTRFEFRTIVKKIIETYEQDGMFGNKKLVHTEEVK
ncbi:MAG: hypothetical protein PHP03_00435 [Candidatus Pacebacteria bacterium]|nr:hypothetical protein [Candidatus Paceibacterota bacterium]